jgi:hypothetical protein
MTGVTHLNNVFTTLSIAEIRKTEVMIARAAMFHQSVILSSELKFSNADIVLLMTVEF